MKRVCVWILLILFSVGFASAQSCDGEGDSQLMFKISGETNAHAELWDQIFYNEEICFSHFYIENYDSGGSEHDSTSTNKMLGLSGETNAHAELPEQTNYDEEVHYGDLICELRILGIDPPCSELVNNGHRGTRIVTLSGETNAHVARGIFYIHHLCCASASTDPLLTVCGDDYAEGYEECDGSDLGEHECSDFPGYVGGNLGCTPNCMMDFSGCDEGGEYPECFIGDPSGEGHWLEIDGELKQPVSCNDYNEISDAPPGWDLDEFKETMCADCSQFIPDSAFYDSGWIEEDGFNPYCYWDTSDEECRLGYSLPGGESCVINVLEDAVCESGMDTKTIKITDTCRADEGCTPELGGCEVVVECPHVIQLPFSSSWGLVLAVILIVSIYWIYENKRK